MGRYVDVRMRPVYYIICDLFGYQAVSGTVVTQETYC
jgi:hypothetical protein